MLAQRVRRRPDSIMGAARVTGRIRKRHDRNNGAMPLLTGLRLYLRPLSCVLFVGIVSVHSDKS